MEDLSDIIKRGFISLYKQKHEVHTVTDRVVKMIQERKRNRHEEIFEKRKIPPNMSPIVTPAPKRERTPTKPKQNVKRLEMLAKWKEEKQKRKDVQKKILKPVFKVSHVPVNVGLPNLDNVNLEIKGKSFKSKFAPPNHQFKPPANIKPIHFKNPTVQATTKNKKSETSAPNTTHRMTTRSQARGNSSSNTATSRIDKEIKKRVPKSVPKQKKCEKKESETNDQSSKVAVINNNKEIQTKQTIETSLMSPDYPVQNIATSSESDEPKTPKKIDPPVYISPFVTVSRGKNSARKEYEARKSGKSIKTAKSDTDSCASPKAGAAYFMWLLNNQISRLQGLCDQWNKYKEEEDLPEEALSMIDVAIGQTNLLLTKKFAQFQGLIDKCRNEDSDTRVTCEDLHGFWDMIHLQVVNLDKRFENLDNLKTNNWEEILPVVKKEAVKKKGKTSKNVKASAGLREAILAARRKKQNVEEPKEEVVEKKTPKNRRSSNRLVDVRTEEKRRLSSPGLMMMKVAQYAKSVETPAKSILKTDTQKSAKSQSKTVFFRDDFDKSIENVENDLNKSNSQTKSKTPSRRSTRLTKSKLF